MGLRSTRLLFSMLLASPFLCSIDLSAQARYVVAGSASCATCTVELRRELTIGGEDGPGALGEVADVYMLPDGGFAITHGRAPEAVTIFAKSGALVRALGRAGRGPGEFRYALFVRPSGNGLMVADPAARRAVVFDDQLAPRFTIALPGELMAAPIVLDSAHIALNAIVRTKERIGLLVHIVDTAGRLVRSIAPSAGGLRFDVPGETYVRSLSATPRGSFWVAGRTRYTFDEYSKAGDLLRTFNRDTKWFPAHTAGDMQLDPKRPAKPRLLSIREDDRGRIWTVTRTASANWSRVLKPKRGPAGQEQQPYEFESYDQLYDTVVEVIDSRSGRLLASRILDIALGHFIGEDRVISFGEKANGDWVVHVWSLALKDTTVP